MKKLLICMLTVVAMVTSVMMSGCGKDPNTIYVGILQVTTHTALDNAREGFKAKLNEWAKLQNKKVVYDEQNPGGDMNNEITYAKKIVANNPDIVLGISTSSARALGLQTSTIPVLYTAVTDPEGEKFVRDNMTGTSDMNPVDEQIKLIKELVPDCDKIGFLYNSSENNSEVQFRMADAVGKELGIEVIKQTVSLSNDINTVVGKIGINDGIDAVYVPTDNLMAENMNLICNKLYSNGIVVIAGETGMCEDGEGCGTLGIDYRELGVQTAEIAIRILKGEKPGSIAFKHYTKKPTFYLNESNLVKAGVTMERINEVKAKHLK